MFSPYVGIAGGYEFCAKSSATIQGRFETASPNVTGITGFADLGINIAPSEDMPITMALNFGGYIGEIDGLDISFDIVWLF